MLVKKVLVSALFAVGIIGAVATPVSSLAQVEIQLNFGPPADRYEAVPAPRYGYLWAPGYWQWNASNNNHYWTTGSWHVERPGYVYRRPQWVQSNGRWQYQASRWDSDGDGIPNNRDATPYGGSRSSLAQGEIQLNFGPPADRYEAVPAPRYGYLWAPGYWQWNASNNNHYWTTGSWHVERPGYVYRRPQWVQSNGRWQYQASRWDSDGDGIPNNRDSTPYGTARARDSDRDGTPDYRDSTPYGGRRPGDRDGDGVPDYRDSQPNNPNRG